MRCQNLILGCEDVKLLYSRKYEHEDREIRDMAILEYNEKMKREMTRMRSHGWILCRT